MSQGPGTSAPYETDGAVPAGAATPSEPPRDTAVWEQRFRAVRISLPEWAEDAPSRCLYLSNATGTFELYTWDRDTGVTRQLTSRPNGTSIGTLPPDGENVWWFADTDGDEYGVWMRQPFGSGPDAAAEPAAPSLGPSYPSGLALGRDGTSVIGRSDDGGTNVWLIRRGQEPALVYEHENDAHVGDLSRDTTLLCLAHSEHGSSRHMALRVLRLGEEGATLVAELYDGPSKGLDVLGFAPRAGDTRVLVGHERRGRPEMLLWDPVAGTEQELHLDLPGEVSAQWYPDGTALLVEHEYAARSELYRLDLATEKLQRVDTPPGLISAATARPDGTVEYSWSSSAQPTVLRSTTGATVLPLPEPRPHPSVPVEDVWVDGPGGRVHALISRPASGQAPYPGVFLVHGGPSGYDPDAFAADVAAWVDWGFAVVRVNYRGSTGYGTAWRDAIEGRPGLTELEDIAAVHDWTLSNGLLDPERVVLAGGSWGGYLTLLGLGLQPERWAAGVAAVPVADYVAAYEDEMEPLKAFDRALFGGSPDEVPEIYRDSSPLTYIDAVKAPVLILAGENDPRCPIRQIENYLVGLEERGVPHDTYRYDAGHGSLVVEERLRQQRAELEFATRQLRPGPVPAPRRERPTA